ncbi:MAG: hypothetical protein FGM61_10945 [Sediminibacterium sp.]|nr:hypothetical protein [Sediminibacterium sp.]
MQSWAIGLLATPVLAGTTSPAALLTSLRLKIGLNLGAASVDASLQLITKDKRDFNLISPIINGVLGPESNIFGAAFVSSFTGSMINLTPNSLFGNGTIFNNPLSSELGQSILLSTLFGGAGGYLGGAFKTDLPWGRLYGEFLGNSIGGLGGIGLDETLKR